MKKSLKILIAGLITAGATGVFSFTLIHAIYYAPEPESAANSADIPMNSPLWNSSSTSQATLGFSSSSSNDPSSSRSASSSQRNAPAKNEAGRSQPLPSFYPARLIIPKLGLDANIQYAGINSKGNMMSPTKFSEVAWYKFGTVPGQRGSAVIAGHVDNGLGLDGVFKQLNELAPGDDIFVKTDSGTKLHFVVSDIKSYPYKSVPTDLLFNANDVARLNLLTCEGSWVSDDKTYDHRLVVFTILASN